jgi:hypothetical protein
MRNTLGEVSLQDLYRRSPYPFMPQNHGYCEDIISIARHAREYFPT